jgi:hypothetical protein
METNAPFNVDFNYALSETIIIPLTANVQLRHSTPHYIVSDFHFKENPGGSPLLNDIDIMAIKTSKGISWLHADSRKETVLSNAIGKAIEEKGMVELANEEP